MDNNNFYKKTEQYVTDLFNNSNKPSLVFHNLDHTRNVVERTKEIAGHYYLSEKDMLAVFVAAWFHDTGYLLTDAGHHEEKSVELMKDFMKVHSQDETLPAIIEECIMATRPPTKHDNLLQQIICDADTYHLGTKEFNDSNKKVWQEYNLSGSLINEKEWTERTIELLTHHKYYTKYCKDHLEQTKQKNMKKLKKSMTDYDLPADALSLANLEKDKTGLMSKGIQTMLRMTSANHLRLSEMADQKANILISINAIIISVMLGVLLRKLEEVPYLTIPTIIFLCVAVTTIVISIIATRPKLGGGNFSRQDILDKKVNLLFFGNFHKVSFDEYNEAMKQMMQDTDYLYGSLVKDIYTLGTVLGRKYKLIRLAYNIFMIGIIVSVLAFALAVFIFHSPVNTSVNPGAGSPF